MIDLSMLDELLESILFVSGNGLKIEDIAQHLEIKTSEVNASIKRLKEKYGNKSGIHLLTYNGKAQFASNPAHSDVVACVLNPIRERDLSNAALETIAIIAYRQPVTRLDIEQIRGVNSEYTVQMLLKNNLIEVVGRKDSPGKPLLFGTTDEFLKRFQLENLSDLPDYETLLESIRVIGGGVEPRSIYNEYEIPEEEADAEVAATQTAPEPEQESEEDFELPEEEVPDFLKDEENVVKVD
ncbi:MAG: SMC-Scp complex subunit ScpB [Clostridia bacterium]|nr:SMC-Scp complex subunit ScpB [Clostridia bacterium]